MDPLETGRGEAGVIERELVLGALPEPMDIDLACTDVIFCELAVDTFLP